MIIFQQYNNIKNWELIKQLTIISQEILQEILQEIKTVKKFLITLTKSGIFY